VINVRIEPSSGIRGLHVAEGRNDAECYTAHEGAERRRCDARTRGHINGPAWCNGARSSPG